MSVRRNERDGATEVEVRRGPVSFGKSMISVAVRPRRYYLVPVVVGAKYFTVTAIPRLIDRRDLRKGPHRPMVVTVAALAIAGRVVLRATANGTRRARR